MVQSEDEIGFPRMEYYQLGNKVYAKWEIGLNQWSSSAVNYDEVLIEDNIKLIGSENVDGETCWVLKFKPRVGSVIKKGLEEQGIPKQDFEGLLDDIQTTGKYWITKNYKIKKVEITSTKLTITTRMDFKPVTVKLPEGAKSAKLSGESSAINYNLPNALGIMTSWQLGYLA